VLTHDDFFEHSSRAPPSQEMTDFGSFNAVASIGITLDIGVANYEALDESTVL
jgi:hypothetical protein